MVTVQELKIEATKHKIKGRSKMNKEQLCKALSEVGVNYTDCSKRTRRSPVEIKKSPKKRGTKKEKQGEKKSMRDLFLDGRGELIHNDFTGTTLKTIEFTPREQPIWNKIITNSFNEDGSVFILDSKNKIIDEMKPSIIKYFKKELGNKFKERDMIIFFIGWNDNLLDEIRFVQFEFTKRKFVQRI